MSPEFQISVEQKERRLRAPTLLYHHARRIEYATPGVVMQEGVKVSLAGDQFEERYVRLMDWLSGQTGFNPLFLAVGKLGEATRITGFPSVNPVLFSFSNLDGIFSDYNAWDDIIYGRNKNAETFAKKVFRPELTKGDWIRKSLSEPGAVQLLVSCLDLSKARRITTEYSFQKSSLEDSGFDRSKMRTRI